jgi:hypothetical protein
MPVIQVSLPEVLIQTITITAQMNRISGTREPALIFRTENTAICRNVGDVTAV